MIQFLCYFGSTILRVRELSHQSACQLIKLFFYSRPPEKLNRHKQLMFHKVKPFKCGSCNKANWNLSKMRCSLSRSYIFMPDHLKTALQKRAQTFSHLQRCSAGVPLFPQRCTQSRMCAHWPLWGTRLVIPRGRVEGAVENTVLQGLNLLWFWRFHHPRCFLLAQPSRTRLSLPLILPSSLWCQTLKWVRAS